MKYMCIYFFFFSIVRTCFVSTLERSSKLHSNKYDRSIEPPPPPPSVLYPLSGSRNLTIPGTVRELATEVLFEQDRDALSLPTIILDSLQKVLVGLGELILVLVDQFLLDRNLLFVVFYLLYIEIWLKYECLKQSYQWSWRRGTENNERNYIFSCIW